MIIHRLSSVIKAPYSQKIECFYAERYHYINDLPNCLESTNANLFDHSFNSISYLICASVISMNVNCENIYK